MIDEWMCNSCHFFILFDRHGDIFFKYSQFYCLLVYNNYICNVKPKK